MLQWGGSHKDKPRRPYAPEFHSRTDGLAAARVRVPIRASTSSSKRLLL